MFISVRPGSARISAFHGYSQVFSTIKIKLPKSDEHDVIWGLIKEKYRSTSPNHKEIINDIIIRS